MKSFTYFPLASFYVKYIGLMTVLTGLGLFLWAGGQFQVLVYLGLFLMVFSRERTENDLTAGYRAESFKAAFGLTMALWIALHLTEWISGDFEVVVTPFLIMGTPLLLYLLLFYLSALLRIETDPAGGVTENIRKHRRFYTVWTMITAVIALVMVLKVIHVIP